MATKKRESKRERIFRMMRNKYDEGALNVAVHELMSLRAAEVNNAGFDAQLEYLAEAAGLDWIEDYFLSQEG